MSSSRCGLEARCGDLAFQPREAEAEVTVTAANGRSMILDADALWTSRRRATPRVPVLPRRWTTRPARRPGWVRSPFTYRVDLTLDGERYVGTAVWPATSCRTWPQHHTQLRPAPACVSPSPTANRPPIAAAIAPVGHPSRPSDLSNGCNCGLRTGPGAGHRAGPAGGPRTRRTRCPRDRTWRRRNGPVPSELRVRTRVAPG